MAAALRPSGLDGNDRGMTLTVLGCGQFVPNVEPSFRRQTRTLTEDDTFRDPGHRHPLWDPGFADPSLHLTLARLPGLRDRDAHGRGASGPDADEIRGLRATA